MTLTQYGLCLSLFQLLFNNTVRDEAPPIKPVMRADIARDCVFRAGILKSLLKYYCHGNYRMFIFTDITMEQICATHLSLGLG